MEQEKTTIPLNKSTRERLKSFLNKGSWDEGINELLDWIEVVKNDNDNKS